MLGNKIILLLAMCLAFTSALKMPTSRALLNSYGPFEGVKANVPTIFDAIKPFYSDGATVKLMDARAASSSSSSAPLNNTFCRGPTYVKKATDTSLDDCRQDCLAKQCTAYSFCDPNARNGCDVHTYPSSTEDASTENFKAGTCILTSGEAGVGMLQQAPGWTCGAINVTINTGGCSSGGDGGDCNVQKDTLIIFGNGDMESLQEYPSIPTVDDCCGACKSVDGCNFFWYCHSDSSSCAIKYTDENGDTQTVDGKIKPGSCLLFQASLKNGQEVPVVGDNPFDSGTLSTTNGPKGGGGGGSTSGCKVVDNTFVAVDKSAGSLLTTYQVQSVDDCCSYCKQGKTCNLFQYCHSDADNCDFEYKAQDGSTAETNFGSSIPPGACALWAVTDPTKVQSFSGGAVPWDYGTL